MARQPLPVWHRMPIAANGNCTTPATALLLHAHPNRLWAGPVLRKFQCARRAIAFVATSMAYPGAATVRNLSRPNGTDTDRVASWREAFSSFKRFGKFNVQIASLPGRRGIQCTTPLASKQRWNPPENDEEFAAKCNLGASGYIGARKTAASGCRRLFLRQRTTFEEFQ